MHDAMSLGALLVSPLHPLTHLNASDLAQLAAIGATALFAAANGTPIFCAVFVFTLQGDGFGSCSWKNPAGLWHTGTMGSNQYAEKPGFCLDPHARNPDTRSAKPAGGPRFREWSTIPCQAI